MNIEALMQQQIFVVNAFCHQGQGGNGAGIALGHSSLSPSEKCAIAAQIGLSETVFIGGSSKADFRLEYFTPVDEVELCGHATIAAFVLLQSLGLEPGSYSIETRSGVLQVEVSPQGTIWMQQCLPTFHEKYLPTDFQEALPNARPHPNLPIQAVSTGLKDILFPIESVEVLEQLTPDFEAMAQLNERQQVVGIHAFALTGGDNPIAFCRNFAPRYGIPEESATGTSNCALACYLHQYYRQAEAYRFLQGTTMGCTSAIDVRLRTDNGHITKVQVGGNGQIIKQIK